MRQTLALMLLPALVLAIGVTANVKQQDISYGSAGSEDIYFQPNSVEEQFDEYDGDYAGDDVDVDDDEVEEEEAPPQQRDSDNIEAIGEDSVSCEYSCPRYYRPVCVRRNGQLITYATPCEYHNQLRCTNVARRAAQGTAVETPFPTFQLMYNTACRE